MSRGQHNSAHSNRWTGPSSRANRLARKLGRTLTLKRLEQLLLKKKREER